MDNLIGKLTNEYCNVTTLKSGSVYAKDESSKLIPYDCRYLLESEEWFVINNFSKQGYGDAVNNLENTANFNKLEYAQYREIKYLIFIDNNLFFFEKITPAKILRKKGLFFPTSGEPTLKDNPKIIVFNENPDAVYNKEKDRLSFKKLEALKGIFIGIDALYREATNQETTDFVTKSCVALSGNFDIADIKSANRKRITMVWNNYKDWGISLKKDFIGYALEYCKNITRENGKFVVDNEKELKQILHAMDERYYTTELHSEKRLANSVQTI